MMGKSNRVSKAYGSSAIEVSQIECEKIEQRAARVKKNLDEVKYLRKCARNVAAGAQMHIELYNDHNIMLNGVYGKLDIEYRRLKFEYNELLKRMEVDKKKK